MDYVNYNIEKNIRTPFDPQPPWSRKKCRKAAILLNFQCAVKSNFMLNFRLVGILTEVEADQPSRLISEKHLTNTLFSPEM